MKSASSLRIKLLLALTVALSIVANGAAQTLRKVDLGNNKPRPRSGHTMINVKGRVFMFGGFNASLPPDVDPTAADNFSTQNVYGRKDGAFEFIEEKDQNKDKGKFLQMPGVEGQVPLAFSSASVNQSSGDVFSIFGLSRQQTNFEPNTEIRVFNPIQNTWNTKASSGNKLPQARESAAITYDTNSAFLMGGNGENGVLKDAWRLDLESGLWTELGQMPGDFTGATAAMTDDKDIWVFGGVNKVGDFNGDGIVSGGDYAIWRRVTALSQSKPGEITTQADDPLLARAFSAHVQVGNTVYMFGGQGKNAQELDDIIKIEIKDDDTFTVERLAARFPAGFRGAAAALISLTPIEGFEAASLNTVEILIFGGAIRGRDTDDAFIFTDIVEVATTPDPQPDECTGGPTVKSISVGGKTKIKGNGFSDGLFITVNGIAFNKSPSVTPNKVTQKGPLANGQTAIEACAGGCEFIITNGDNKCTKVTVP